MQTLHLQLVRFTTMTLLTATFAWNICPGKSASITAAAPAAVNYTVAKSGPLVPPDPWESRLTKSGPLVPPDPWES